MFTANEIADNERHISLRYNEIKRDWLKEALFTVFAKYGNAPGAVANRLQSKL